MARKPAWDKASAAAPDQFFGSSDDFRRMVESKYPEIVVPEGAAVYLGESIPMWSPEREAESDGVTCCGGYFGPIGPGSVLVCPRCHHSGHERRLAEQRRLAGYPPAERPRTPAPEIAPKRPVPARPAVYGYLNAWRPSA